MPRVVFNSLWPMEYSTQDFPVHHQLLELAQTHVHWVSDAIQQSYPLSSPSPAFHLSQCQGLFQWVGSSHQVAKVLELQHQFLQWIFRLISFKIDWFDPLAVQGTLKSLQHHNPKASILWCSAFFMVQLSHPYMTTGKIIALTRRTFVDKVMSLLFNMLSRLDFPGGSDGKAFCLQCRRPGFNPCFRKIPWRRNWQPTPVFLPGKSHGRRSLVGCSP